MMVTVLPTDAQIIMVQSGPTALIPPTGYELIPINDGSGRLLMRKIKRGRPRIGEPRTPHRPWEAMGMSERTWYRRKAEAKKQD